MINSISEIRPLSNKTVCLNCNHQINPIKNNEIKDVFVSQKNSTVKLGLNFKAFLQNFTGKLTKKSSDTVQNHSKIYIEDKDVEYFVNRRVEELMPELDKNDNPIEKIYKMADCLDRYSQKCMDLSDGEAGIHSIISDIRNNNPEKSDVLLSVLMEEKAVRLATYFIAYKNIQAEAEILYNDALIYIIKLPKKQQKIILPKLEEKMKSIKAQHINQDFYDDIIEAVIKNEYYLLLRY